MTGTRAAHTFSNMNTLLESILPARALGIQILRWEDGCVELSAPLAPNLNDKGTAFAGSIDALLDLAGWSAITLALRDAGIEAEVMIVKSETHYQAAVRADMTATAKLSQEQILRLLEELKLRGRSRLNAEARLLSGKTECALMGADYAIISTPS